MNIILEHIKSSPSAWIGIGFVIAAIVNHRQSCKIQDEAWDMPEETDADKICRQVSLLETSIRIQSWWLVMALGAILIFLNL